MSTPTTPINKTGITNKHKIQRIQNQATRLITNRRPIDRQRSQHLHTMTKLDTMNVRLDKLATKLYFEIHDKYYNDDIYIDKGTDYEITTDPRQPKQKTLIQTVEEIIYGDPDRCPWRNPLHPSDWAAPNSMYI